MLFVKDKFWTVELALPFSDLVDHSPTASAPPSNKDQWRINFSRFVNLNFSFLLSISEGGRGALHACHVFIRQATVSSSIRNPRPESLLCQYAVKCLIFSLRRVEWHVRNVHGHYEKVGNTRCIVLWKYK